MPGVRAVVAAATASALPAVLALAACGGGGGGGGGGGAGDGGGVSAPLAVVSTALACGDVRYAYDQALVASGGSGSYVWSFVPGMGTLPPGLSLSSAGRITGKPLSDGTWAFHARVADAADPTTTASRLVSIAVGALRIDLDTPHFGDAWPGDLCTIRAPLETSAVSFSWRTNASGGTLLPGGSVPPNATYVPGPVVARDVVRATAANGRFVDLVVDVRPDPFANHVARFGTTDVWWIDFDAKLGTSGFDSDLDAALSLLGLRATFPAPPTTADGLARTLVEKQVLDRLSVLYLNDPDGTPSANGLAISFPRHAPDPPYAAPPDGATVPAAPGLYNVMTIHGQPGGEGMAGRSFFDADNDQVDNATPNAALGNGIYLVNWMPWFVPAHSVFTTPHTPVGPGDEETLRARLYGLPDVAGARAAEVLRVVDAFSRVMAALIAHEIAHAVGFGNWHSTVATSPISSSGSWMLAATTMPVWPAAEVGLLRGWLPGPGR